MRSDPDTNGPTRKRGRPRKTVTLSAAERARRYRGREKERLIKQESVRLAALQSSLSFPYGWSNSAMGRDALIRNVLERGIFEDICRVCAHAGLPVLERLRRDLPDESAASPWLTRMLDNIRKGFARAQT